uniref:hypothetical protein n=1 Tax=Paenarthrobacter ureafaciens TaxID=37931 RepID=UPI003F493F6C
MQHHGDIEQLLSSFISTVRSVSWESPLRVLNSFPNSCCTIASFMLGHLLQDRGFGRWHIVNGSAGPMERHDWLESADGLVVDSTSDQFPWGVPPFVAMGPSPLEKYFPVKQDVSLASWTEDIQAAYARVIDVLDGI